MRSQSKFRRVWLKLTPAASEGKTLGRRPGEGETHLASDTNTRTLRSLPPNLTVKTTDSLVSLFSLATRSLLP